MKIVGMSTTHVFLLFGSGWTDTCFTTTQATETNCVLKRLKFHKIWVILDPESAHRKRVENCNKLSRVEMDGKL